MKVVKLISSGEIKYNQTPEFEPGFGITNSVILFGGSSEDYEEVEISQEEWDAFVTSQEGS